MSTLATVDRALAERLVQSAERGSSGIVTCVRGKLKRLFCIDAGALVHARSNVIEEQLAAQLVARKLLQTHQLASATRSAEQHGVPLTTYLARESVLAPADLADAAERHLRDLLFATLDWSDGECHFANGRPDLGQELQVRLPVLRLLLDYARRRPASLAETRARIGPPVGRPVVVRARAALLDDAEPDKLVRQLLERCDGSRSAAQILASAQPQEGTWRALYGLVLTGAVQLERVVAGRPAAPADAPVSRSEVLARLERAEDADHYGVLELPATCTREEVRDAYYFLARRYHPDRFRSGDLADLRLDIERFFTRVTEAYNTLWDPETRTEYDLTRDTETAPAAAAEQDTRYLARQNYLRAKALIEKGRYTDAAGYLQNAVQLDDRQSTYQLELGLLLSGNPRRRDEAERHLTEARRLDPTSVDPYLALARLYVKMQRRDDAIEAYREALRWEPGHLEAEAELREVEAGEGSTGRLRNLFRG